jgi:anaerobic magnesium-protoporphyrin IX monomethyl ester cyclase
MKDVMRVALISPFAEISSIGLRTLSAYLKAHGVATRLIFMPLQKTFYSREAFSLYPDSVITNLAELVQNDDIIGISVMSNFFDTLKDFTLKLKAKLPGKPIVWGGIHPTVAPEQCIALADYVCIGRERCRCWNSASI